MAYGEGSPNLRINLESHTSQNQIGIITKVNKETNIFFTLQGIDGSAYIGETLPALRR